MNPLYFGSSERRLYGVYHPPRTRDTRTHGIVLCYPTGQEYMRAHRAFRQLAILLARSGFPVLRFDYFGTGDSAGESDAGTLEQWIEDIGTAIDELKDNAGVDKVALVGLRLGAALAARVQATRSDVTNVVLWDPVIVGSGYLAELMRAAVGGDDVLKRAQTSDVIDINGFAWTRALRTGLDNVTLESYPITTRSRIALLISREADEYTQLRDRYAALQNRFVYECIPSPGDWAYIDAYGSALLPQDIIQGIVGHLNRDLQQ